MPEKTIVVGVDRVLKNFDMSKKGAASGMKIGLIRAALHLQMKSMQIVPVLTSALQKTARVSSVRGRGAKQDISVSYGGRGSGGETHVRYAVYVHEDPKARHKPGKTYKFLERPAKEERREMLKMLAESISDGIKRGF